LAGERDELPYLVAEPDAPEQQKPQVRALGEHACQVERDLLLRAIEAHVEDEVDVRQAIEVCLVELGPERAGSLLEQAARGGQELIALLDQAEEEARAGWVR